MVALFAIGALGIVTLIVVMRLVHATPIDLVDIPWPPVVIIASMVAGAALFGVFVGEYVQSGVPGLALLAAIVGCFAFLCSPLIYFQHRRYIRAAEAGVVRAAILTVRGITVAASVKSAERTGLLVDDVPQMVITVVAKRGAMAIEGTRRMLIEPQHSESVKPGAPACLVYDPQDHDNYKVYLLAEDWDSEADDLLLGQQRLLDQLNETGLVGNAAIRSCAELPIDIQGVGTMVLLHAEIQPWSPEARVPGESFEADFLVAIAKARIARYQPGKNIWVRYDPDDHSRVSIDFAREDGTVIGSDSEESQ